VKTISNLKQVCGPRHRPGLSLQNEAG
jgi:hypothetical protein